MSARLKEIRRKREEAEHSARCRRRYALYAVGPMDSKKVERAAKLLHFFGVTGIGAGGVYSMNGDGPGTRSVGISFRGKRTTILWWPRYKWACLLKRRHWPTPYRVVFGLCGKCCPCPECGSTGPLDHVCAAGVPESRDR